MPRKIHGIGLKYRNGRLQFSDNRRTEADNTDVIIWYLENNSRVTSFQIIQKGGANVFKRPPYQSGDIWIGEVRDDVPYDSEFVYRVRYYREGDPTSYTTDPIISIKPHAFLPPPVIAPVLGVVIGVLASILYWHKKKTDFIHTTEKL